MAEWLVIDFACDSCKPVS